jgi:uncharacterized membrane protein YdjX (TVP38/TMEM64 family)
MTDTEPHQDSASAGTTSPVPAGGLLPGLKASALLVFLLLAFVGLRYTEAGAYLAKERIQAVVGDFGLLAPLAHVVVYTLGSTALVPATVFTLMGAVLFGKLLGGVYNLIGATGGAALSFLLARSLGRDFAARLATGKLQNLDARAGEHGFMLICYLRLVYLPFAPVNYAAGLTRMRFLDYVCGSALGMLPGMFLITAFVDELTNLGSPADLLTRRFLLLLVLFALSLLLPVMLKRVSPAIVSTRPSRNT